MVSKKLNLMDMIKMFRLLMAICYEVNVFNFLFMHYV